MSEPERFIDPGVTRWDLLDDILVRCPNCTEAAHVHPNGRTGTEPAGPFSDRQLVCGSCGHTREWPGERNPEPRRMAWWPDGRDPYFGHPLILRVPCAGETLWAYNQHHLALLEDFVGAHQRARSPNLADTQSLVELLPRWIKSAKNRDAVLKGCRRLRDLLADDQP